MKTSLAISALALASISVANPVSASDYKFMNIGGFTATGTITVTAGAVSAPCAAVLSATTSDGAQVTAATFTGSKCMGLTASNLPWRVHANGPHSLTISSVTLEAAELGVCGPGKIKAQLNKIGSISFSGAQLPGTVPCSVSGNLKTSPKLEIIAKK